MKLFSLLLTGLVLAVNAVYPIDTGASTGAPYFVQSNAVVGKVSVVGDINNITVILFENVPEDIKLFHVYDRARDRVVGTVMVKNRADTYVGYCTLVDGEITDIKRSQELYLNYNVSVPKKKVKFLDIGISMPFSYFAQNNFFISNVNGNVGHPFFFWGGSFIAEFLESILIGFSVSGGWNFQGPSFLQFSAQGKYIFGNPDDVLSLYLYANLGISIYSFNSSPGTYYYNNMQIPLFAAEPGFGVIVFRKFNFQVFVEAGYKVPIYQDINSVAGLNISVGANIFFTKSSI